MLADVTNSTVADTSLAHRPSSDVAGLERAFRRQAAARRLRWDALTVTGWLSVSLSVALFLADGGSRQFGDLARAVTSLGIIAGLIATDLVVVMLILSARVPFIDRTLGQPRAIEVHGRLGNYAIVGLLLHAVLLLAGYSLAGRLDLVGEFTALWHESGDFILAVLGFLALAIVGLSSILAVRRRFPYEFWFGIHLTTYLAVGISIPHMFSLGAVFAPGTIEHAYWIGLLLLTAFLVLTFRVFYPLINTLRRGLRVSAVVPAGPDAVSIEFTGRGLAALEARAGQWFIWRFWSPGLIFEAHPFSLSAAPDAEHLRITVRNLGRGSARVVAVRPGTRVAIEGPYGLFSEAARTRDAVVLIGAGAGIAPLRGLLEQARFAPGRGCVILRASTVEGIYLLDEFRELCRVKGAELILLPGKRAGSSWLPAVAAVRGLSALVPWVAQADVFVCGPDAWMDAVISDAAASGVPDEQIHDERFSW